LVLAYQSGGDFRARGKPSLPRNRWKGGIPSARRITGRRKVGVFLLKSARRSYSIKRVAEFSNLRKIGLTLNRKEYMRKHFKGGWVHVMNFVVEKKFYRKPH